MNLTMKTTKVIFSILASLGLLVACTNKKGNNTQDQQDATPSFAGIYVGVDDNQADWGNPVYLSITEDGAYQMIVKKFGESITPKMMGEIAYTKGNEAFSVTDAYGQSYTFSPDAANLVTKEGLTLTKVDDASAMSKLFASFVIYEAKALDDKKDKDVKFEVVADADHICLQNIEIKDMADAKDFTYDAEKSKTTGPKALIFSNDAYTIEILPNDAINIKDNHKEGKDALLSTAKIMHPLTDIFTADADQIEVNYFTEDGGSSALVLDQTGKALVVKADVAWSKGSAYINEKANYKLVIDKDKATVNNKDKELSYTIKKK